MVIKDRGVVHRSPVATKTMPRLVLTLDLAKRPST
ncbi:DUF1826 domain-containing protein [Teredinibacter purpureus]